MASLMRPIETTRMIDARSQDTPLNPEIALLPSQPKSRSPWLSPLLKRNVWPSTQLLHNLPGIHKASMN